MKNTRNTKTKTAILELIKASDVALSHSEIQKLNRELCDRVTIYRILDRLVIEDLVHKVVTLEGIIKYAACHHNQSESKHLHNHIHFNCEKCLSVTCLDSVEPSYTIPNNYLVKEVNFTLSGLCQNCSKVV